MDWVRLQPELTRAENRRMTSQVNQILEGLVDVIFGVPIQLSNYCLDKSID